MITLYMQRITYFRMDTLLRKDISFKEKKNEYQTRNVINRIFMSCLIISFFFFSIFQCGIQNFATNFFLVVREKCYKEHHGLM